MKVSIDQIKEIEVKYVRVELPVRPNKVDLLQNFPFLEENNDSYWWKAIIELDTGKILEWPAGKIGEFYLKVVDEGSYFLLDQDRKVIAKIEQNYAPNKLLPPVDGYSDYVNFKINKNGIITNWYKRPVLTEFFD